MKHNNGRKGIITSWNKNAIDYFKLEIYKVYEQFNCKIYLTERDKVLLLSCYNGKSYKNVKRIKNKNQIIKEFILRQFSLMGYPKSSRYVEMINGIMVIDFGINKELINQNQFNKYLGKKRIVRLNGKNEAHKSPTIKDNGKGNDKLLTENVNKDYFNIDELKGGND